MSEEEHWESDSEFEDDDEIFGEFLIEEPDDITLIMLPRLDFDLEKTLEEYYRVIKKCRNKEQLMNALRHFYAYISGVTSIMNDIQYLQDRAKELEFQISMLHDDIR